MDTLDRISAILLDKKLNQRDLTDHLGLSKGIFTSWKSGLSSSYLKYINQIADFLGTTPNYLLNGDPGKEITDDDIKFALFEGAEDITEDMYQDVVDYARFVLERKRKQQSGK